MKHINQIHEVEKSRKIKPYMIEQKKWSRLLKNVEDIVWKEDNLDQKVGF